MYFDQVYTQLTNIMQQSIAPEVTDTYAPLKADPSSTPSILHEALKPFVRSRERGACRSVGLMVNYDQVFQQKAWSYSLSWNTTGGTAPFDGGVGTVAASGTLSFAQQNSPPTLPSTLTVIGPYGDIVRQLAW